MAQRNLDNFAAVQTNWKVQDVMATLTLEESMDYDIVKAAILRVYELVAEAYRQKFKTKRKPPPNHL